ncbi:MAG: TetR/AcrR family transcriptional regulator [Acidimicrobiia bacterium]|nr:TetR/AcrR family transcriptional regulator [Acidimicrobiia bacterium]
MPRIRAASIEEHKLRTRSDILEAAGALFSAQGYGGTGLGDIAAIVGIGRTTLYEYFPDKESILVELVEERLPGVVADMLDGLPDRLSHRERLSEVLVRGIVYVSTDDHLGSVVMRELPRLSPAAQRRIAEAHEALPREIVRICREGIEAGEFRPFDPEEAGRIVSALMMSASSVLLRDADAKNRMHEMADTIVRFVFEGLSA